MELLCFGYSGAVVLFFPTRTARFYDYENWRIIESLRYPIENGFLQVYCLDSIDQESFYCFWAHPAGRMIRHLQYEQYIVNEVLPLTRQFNTLGLVMAAGCSMGAYHAVNLGLKYPDLVHKIVGMSGRYDLTSRLGCFNDLLDGYFDENVYYNMPIRYVPNINDDVLLSKLRKLDISLVVGKEDVFLDSNQQLSYSLWGKGIHNKLYLWEGEAHNARYWRSMVQWYL